MKTAWQYIRISDEDQSNFSISGQQMLNAEFARRNKIDITRTFIDDGYSAKDFNRPDWKKLEAELTRNKVDYLIVTKYDRLIRNALEGLTFVERLEQKLNTTLLSVMENYSIDPEDPYFFKHRADIFVDADFERRRIADRTKMGNWSARSQGRFIGVAPFGYTNARGEDNKPIIVMNEAERRAIEGIFNDYLNDIPLVHVLKRAKENGFTRSGKDVLYRVLSNPVYAGLIKAGSYKSEAEKIVPGLHQPIISEDTYWTAFYKLKEQTRVHKPTILDEKLPLRGFLLCPCGKLHTGTKCKGRSAHYYYYWCGTCKGKTYRSEVVGGHMTTILQGLSLKPKVLHALKVETEKELESTQQDRKHRLQKAISDREKLAGQVESIERKYIQDKINEETYVKWHGTYAQDLHRASMLLSKLKDEENIIASLYSPYMQYMGDLAWLFENAPLSEKIPLMRGIFPAGLTTISQGYRTAFLPPMLSSNAATVADLLSIDAKTGSTFSVTPRCVPAMGGLIEPLLHAISRIVKAA